MQSRNIWQQLASNGKTLICPRCGYEWEPRISNPKGCPCCRLIFHKCREKVPAGYETYTFYDLVKGTDTIREYI